MAKKRRVVQRAQTTAETPPPADATTATNEAATPATPAPVRRRVQRAGAHRPARIARGSTAADAEPLDPADAAIPFDRVPYVPADLRRVAVMAFLMLVLIVVAAYIVPRVIGS